MPTGRCLFFDREPLSASCALHSFGATLYPAPETSKARRELAEQVVQRMNDMQIVRAALPQAATGGAPATHTQRMPHAAAARRCHAQVLQRTQNHRRMQLEGIRDLINDWVVRCGRRGGKKAEGAWPHVN